MQRTTYSLLLMAAFFLLALNACKKWNDHNEITAQALNENLMDQISERANLSLFKLYLVKTGLDKEIASSKNYTVWAPTDDVLKTLPAETVNNTASLKAFLLNHIAGQLYFTRNASDSVRAFMLNGKRVFFYQKHFDDANITDADIYVKNGVLHVIDKAVAPLPSVWEYLDSTKAQYAQNAFIAALSYQKQDPSRAQVDSINPVTGEIVYKPGTGMVTVNSFIDKVYDLANEDSLYTYIILTNDAYNTEKGRQAPFFKSDFSAITDSNSAWNVVKDLAIKGLYTPDNLPDTLWSKFNVRVPSKKATIVESHKVSNGMVYVLNASASLMKDKIQPSIVQGETPYAFKLDVTAKTFYRLRQNELTGQPFTDIYLQQPGTSFWVQYLANDVYTTKYKVYWVSLSDYTYRTNNDDYPYGTQSPFQQRLAMDSATNATTFPYVTVNPMDYTETLIGEYTKGKYDFPVHRLETGSGSVKMLTPATLQMFLTSATTTPNYLSLDYIKFVPVLD